MILTLPLAQFQTAVVIGYLSDIGVSLLPLFPSSDCTRHPMPGGKFARPFHLAPGRRRQYAITPSPPPPMPRTACTGAASAATALLSGSPGLPDIASPSPPARQNRLQLAKSSNDAIFIEYRRIHKRRSWKNIRQKTDSMADNWCSG